MASLTEFDKFFETYNPSGRGIEEWNMWCQAFVARCCKFDGNWKRDYLTARAARLASGPLSKDMSNIPIGAFGYWYWEPDDDVAIYVGGGRWMRGSRHVTTQFGGVARNAGTGSFESFQSSARLPFLGWSKTNGGNTVNVTTLIPAGQEIVGNPVKIIYKTTTQPGGIPLWALGDDEAIDPAAAGFVETRDSNKVTNEWAPRYGKFHFYSESEFGKLRTKYRTPRTNAPGGSMTDEQVASLGTALAKAIKVPTAKEVAQAVVAEMKLPGN